MKYYSRETTKRVAINRFGKLGFKRYIEYVKTNSIDEFNKGKKIKFIEDEDVKKELRHLNVNSVYEKEI